MATANLGQAHAGKRWTHLTNNTSRMRDSKLFNCLPHLLDRFRVEVIRLAAQVWAVPRVHKRGHSAETVDSSSSKKSLLAVLAQRMTNLHALRLNLGGGNAQRQSLLCEQETLLGLWVSKHICPLHSRLLANLTLASSSPRTKADSMACSRCNRSY